LAARYFPVRNDRMIAASGIASKIRW